jgi:hypothetical protein
MLVITDRTKPKLYQPKQIESRPSQPLTLVEQYRQITESLKGRRKEVVIPPYVRPSKPTPISEKSIIEVAEIIKESRAKVHSEVKPTQIMRDFVCQRKNGDVLIVTPTEHAIEQFSWRYWIMNRKFVNDTKENVISVMMEMFNKGKRRSHAIYLERNANYRKSVSSMHWGTRSYNFVVDPCTKTIITFELTGDYKPFNLPKFKTMVNLGIFDHDKMFLNRDTP